MTTLLRKIIYLTITGFVLSFSFYLLPIKIYAQPQYQDSNDQSKKDELEKKNESEKKQLEKKNESEKKDDNNNELNSEENKSENQKKIEKKRRESKLDEAKLKVCQNREDSIKNIMNRISDRGTKQMEVFTKITDNIQDYYTKKGLSLDNYQTLVDVVNTNKTIVQAKVKVIQEDKDSFSCDSEHPLASIEDYKTDARAMNEALKTYKNSVKDLLVAVKSIQSTESKSN